VISNICFPSGTPIQTDQGIIPIEKLDKLRHTINRLPILHITQTVTLDKYLIAFAPNSVSKNLPKKTTVMSKDHQLEFAGRLFPAERFLDYSTQVKKVKYNGELLYNVLFAEYGRLNVNGLICESLHPENIIAQLYTKGYTAEERNTIIVQLNDALLGRDLQSYKDVLEKIQKRRQL